MTSLSALAQEQIARLHRECISDSVAVKGILEKARKHRIGLHAGVSRTAAARWCQIVLVDEDALLLECEEFSPLTGRCYYFTFELDGDEFFFGSVLESAEGRFLRFEYPFGLYRVERRESSRVPPPGMGLEALAVLDLDGSPSAAVTDVSRGGLGLRISKEVARTLPNTFKVHIRQRSGVPSRLYAEVRNIRADGRDARLGLSVSSVPSNRAIIDVHRDPLHERDGGWRRVSVAGQVAATAVDRALRRVGGRASGRPRWSSRVVRFRNQLGQELVGLINSSGDTRGAPAVIIPPAWGKTKETLLPLALTIIETGMQNGLPVTVLRFDGTNRRGESYIDPDCSEPGDEYRRFRFSQAVEDLHAAIRFLRHDPELLAAKSVVVSFSLSAIESRRAVAEAGEGVVGWIPVVGMVDLQSGLRAVSGGVDYAEGILRGVSFGRHELVGVLADMDFTGRDALKAGLVFREDARRDMARIRVPVTWVHGEHDAWIDIERVRDLLSAGGTKDRRLIEVPTGHQLRSSREALRTFELVAGEALRMLWRRDVKPVSPPLRSMDRARAAESQRRRATKPVGLRDFWTDYLMGRQRLVGMDLLTATSTYRELMQAQISALELHPGEAVLDLGAGTGGLLRELLASKQTARVVAVDLVPEALKRARGRYARMARRSAFVQVDFDRAPTIPVSDCSMDAVLASLLISYLQDPVSVLRDVRRVMRPGGRLVVSSLKRDADISSIYAAGVAELVAAGAEREIVADGISFAEVQRSFLNEAARLLDLEEQGLFRFYDRVELVSILRRAGFDVVAVTEGLGIPPQATVAVGTPRGLGTN